MADDTDILQAFEKRLHDLRRGDEEVQRLEQMIARLQNNLDNLKARQRHLRALFYDLLNPQIVAQFNAAGGDYKPLVATAAVLAASSEEPEKATDYMRLLHLLHDMKPIRRDYRLFARELYKSEERKAIKRATMQFHYLVSKGLVTGSDEAGWEVANPL